MKIWNIFPDAKKSRSIRNGIFYGLFLLSYSVLLSYSACFYCTVAISISVSFLISVFSRLVTSALAVSIAVSTFTPVSIAFLRITNPSLACSAPCAGISITRSILCPRIRSRQVRRLLLDLAEPELPSLRASFRARCSSSCSEDMVSECLQIFVRSPLHLPYPHHELS